uniref:BESS domain-containing protein n=1 Tax=Strongyloides venezuelensis TaxID=75913 RepID=A0A0K0FUV4_STRVS
MATSSDIFVNLAEENYTYKINDNSTNIGNDYIQATDILAFSNISENPSYSENNISTLSSPFLSTSSTIFSKDQFNTDYDIPTSITAEKLHSLIIQGDKVLSDNFLRLFMQSPPLTEYLSRILIRNTEIAMERLRLMQLTNELNLSNYSSGLSTPLPPQTHFEPLQCNSPSTEIASSVTSDTSSEISLYEEVVNEVLMESTKQLTQHEYEAILGMLQLKNSCN